MDEWFSVVHIECKGIAFYYDHRPKAGELIESAHATYPDGTAPAYGETMKCANCGGEIWAPELLRVAGGFRAAGSRAPSP